MVQEWVELCGDRAVVDDPALMAGTGRIGRHRAAVLACRPAGADFGAGGLRKAMRMLELAERFGLAVVTIVQVSGHHPSGPQDGAMWLAVGQCMDRFLATTAPTLAVLVGEGVSGGALALTVCDRLIALENSFLCATAPEGVAAILWRQPGRAAQAAELLRLGTEEPLRLGLCDEVIPEGDSPVRDAVAAAACRHLDALTGIDTAERLQRRRERHMYSGPVG
jgi:acetyl-CoA carboxylase alpha subunit